MRILIIEDEEKLAELIAINLQKNNFAVDICNDGEEGAYNALTGAYDLIILDIMLPGKNGFEILSEIRKEKIDSKIIMLTAKSMLEDKLAGLGGGANDYITKPFHMEELIARVKIQLNDPSQFKSKDKLEYADLKLNLSESKLLCTKSGDSVELIKKEFQILEYFMLNSTNILSKGQIYDKVWGIENESESNNLEAYISFLRKKLKAVSSSVNIKAVRGMGYKLEVKDE